MSESKEQKAPTQSELLKSAMKIERNINAKSRPEEEKAKTKPKKKRQTKKAKEKV